MARGIPRGAVRHFSGQRSAVGELIRWENQHLPCSAVQSRVPILPPPNPGTIRIPGPEAAGTRRCGCTAPGALKLRVLPQTALAWGEWVSNRLDFLRAMAERRVRVEGTGGAGGEGT